MAELKEIKLKRINIIIAVLILAVITLLFALSFKKSGLPFLSGYKAGSLYKQAENLNKENKKEEAIKIYERIIKNFPKSFQADKALYSLGQIYESKNDLLKAKEAYETLIFTSSNLDFISSVQEQLGNLNMKLLLSPIKTADSQIYEVQPGDTLTKIAARFNTTVDLIKRSNSLKSDNIRAGIDLKINKAKFTIIIDKSQNLLTLKSDEKVLKVYPTSTGADNCTPTGTFTITNKLANPVWYTTGAVIPAGSPDNILGSHWLGLSQAGYGIHGTTQPESIGKYVTQGCVRLLNRDVEELFIILPLHTKVTIVE